MTNRDTQTKGEKIAKMEARQDSMAADIEEIKKDIKEIKDFMYRQDTRFVTRQELNFLKWVVGIVATGAGLFFLIVDHWKS